MAAACALPTRSLTSISLRHKCTRSGQPFEDAMAWLKELGIESAVERSGAGRFGRRIREDLMGPFVSEDEQMMH